MSLRKKVQALFEYRRLPDMLSVSEIQNKKDFEKHLYALQISIYHLDRVLESSWMVDEDELNTMWKKIYTCMEQLGYANENADTLLRNIRIYERHELNMRKDKWPTVYTMKYLYYYKSCDVKLMRKLICQSSKISTGLLDENAWRYFDLITEVNDDVEDVYEDQYTINGNRFLISLIQNGKDKTYHTYKDFLVDIHNKGENYFSLNTKSHKMIISASKEVYVQTLDLLESRIDQIDMKELRKSRISPFLQLGKAS